MPRVRIVAGWWDELTGSGYVRHRSGVEVDVSDVEAERLVRAGAAVVVADVKPKPRRGKADLDK